MNFNMIQCLLAHGSVLLGVFFTRIDTNLQLTVNVLAIESMSIWVGNFLLDQGYVAIVTYLNPTTSIFLRIA